MKTISIVKGNSKKMKSKQPGNASELIYEGKLVFPIVKKLVLSCGFVYE